MVDASIVRVNHPKIRRSFCLPGLKLLNQYLPILDFVPIRKIRGYVVVEACSAGLDNHIDPFPDEFLYQLGREDHYGCN